MNLPIKKKSPEDIILFDGYRIAKLEYDLELYKKKHPVLNKEVGVKDFNKIVDDLGKKGKTSIVYLVATLYKYAPLRNDYSNMVLIRNANDIEPNKNYMILPDKGNAKINIQKHKTFNKHGAIEFEFPTDASNLIRQYVKKEKIGFNDKLFKDLTPILPQITHDDNNDKQEGGTRFLRRCVASTLYNQYTQGKATAKDVYNQIRVMGHSSNTHTDAYIYGIVK
jgi:hypothetical protein